MISGFLLIITLGHFYAVCLIIFVIYQMYSEIMSLKRNQDKDLKTTRKLLNRLTILMILFMVAPKFFLRRSLLESAFSPGSFVWLLFYKYHAMVSFALVIISFVTFVLNLSFYGHITY